VGEGDTDGETAFRSWVSGHGRPVGSSDRSDDGQAEPVTVSAVGATRVEALEAREEPVDLARWDIRTGVRHREGGLPVDRWGGDVNLSPWRVVRDGVADKAGDESLDQFGVAVEGSGAGALSRCAGRACRCATQGAPGTSSHMATRSILSRWSSPLSLLARARRASGGLPIGARSSLIESRLPSSGRCYPCRGRAGIDRIPAINPVRYSR
jgi:hypothetical protein